MPTTNFEQDKNFEISKQETVEMRTLDSVFQEIMKDFDEYNLFVKIDTQGFDLQVVEGGKSTIKKAKCVQSEISFIPIYNSMPNYIDSLRVFESLGFQVSGLYKVATSKNFAGIEFDCIMVKSK